MTRAHRYLGLFCSTLLLSLGACSVETDDSSSFAPPADDGGDGSDGAGDTGADDGGDGDTGGDGDGDGDGPATCGNGTVEGAEQCDDAGESATCNKDCTAAVCGDGKLNVSAGEDCEGEVAYENAACTDCALECEATYGDCNEDLDIDGCETWLALADNCGTCGNTCGGGTLCVDGGCVVTDTHGNDEEFGEGNVGKANNLLGNRIAIPAGKVSHLSLIAKQGGQKVVMALYADQGGSPGALVANTPELAVEIGVNELPIGQAVDVAAGDYWLLAVFDQDASVGIDTSNPNEVVHYIPFGFGASLPDPMVGAQSYTGQRLNYYVNMVP